jgi:hypothetical protein
MNEQILPPLPEPEAYRHREETSPAWSYTAEQMRAYGEACYLAGKSAKLTPVSVEEAGRLMASVS